MKPSSQSIVFTQTPASLTVAIVFVLVVLGLAIFAWRRSGFRASTGMLEALRVVIAIGIAITLNQPEWREIFTPESKPTLLVLHDTSHSMETRDIVDPQAPAAPLKSRAELAKPLVDLTA